MSAPRVSIIIAVFALLLTPSIWAVDAEHLGVANCANGVCHGAISPRRVSTVDQNEYVVWSQHDRHAKAYDVLLGEQSLRIAKKLGLPHPETAAQCLVCHADYPVAHPGAKFQIDDGVGCEACHGGAEDWLRSHASGASHADNIAHGLRDLADPVVRAGRCLDCHAGTATHIADHALMAAGHPRLSFEVDTFMVLQPVHYVFDADYRKRKTVTEPVRNWLLGQLLAAQRMLQLLDTPLFLDGVMPEPALFDCHACHHAMNDSRFAASAVRGTRPGEIRLNDSALTMLRIAIAALDPAEEKNFAEQIRQLHADSHHDRHATAAQAQRLSTKIDEWIHSWRNKSIGDNATVALRKAVIVHAAQADFYDYAAAEQAVMLLALLEAVEHGGATKHSPKLETLYSLCKDEQHFAPRAFQQALATW